MYIYICIFDLTVFRKIGPTSAQAKLKGSEKPRVRVEASALSYKHVDYAVTFVVFGLVDNIGGFTRDIHVF